jgi:hypothetical protein
MGGAGRWRTCNSPPRQLSRASAEPWKPRHYCLHIAHSKTKSYSTQTCLQPSMASQLRNKQGCWTCRLRKKKCDEHHPQCTTCQALSIPCYGYGPKPDCMDGGTQEKLVLQSLKDVVKKTSRRKPPMGLEPRSGSLVRLEQKPLHDVANNSNSDNEPPKPDARNNWRTADVRKRYFYSVKYSKFLILLDIEWPQE